MAVAIRHSLFCIVDSAGVPISGAKFYIYAATTTTPLTLYSDTGLSVAADNPIVTDSDGVLPLRYIATASYKITATTSAGAALSRYSGDNIDPGVAVGSGALPVASGGTGATSAGSARTNLGAASETTVTNLSSDVTTLQGYHTGTSHMPVAAGTTAQRPGSPAAGNVRYNSTTGLYEGYDAAGWAPFSRAQPIAGGFKNLVVTNNSGTPNTKIDVDADAVTVETTGGVAYRLSTIDLTIDTAGTGANGLDAGILGNSQWYAVFVIYNPTTETKAGLISTSGTGPTLPSGYTAFARIGWVRTNSSAQFLRTLQKGRRAQYVVSASITTALPLLFNGARGTYSATAPSWATESVSSVVPSTAVMIGLFAVNNYNGGSNGNVLVAPNANYAGIQSANPPPFANAMTTGEICASPGWVTLESTNLSVVGGATGSAVYVLGWEDSF